MAQTILIETQFLPPISFCIEWIQSDILLVETNEHYQKRSYRNKCRILSSTGIQTLSIPLSKGKHSGQLITHVKISYTQPWVAQMKKQIMSAYGKSPYYQEYHFELFDILDRSYTGLLELNMACLNLISKELQWHGRIGYTEQFKKNYPPEILDFRDHFSPVTANKSEKKIVPDYMQVFSDRFGFTPGLSILDLLFNLGPESASWLESAAQKIKLSK